MPLSVTPPAGRELLAGKVVVVTAAAGTGIGSATARRCLEEGARVVISDSHARRLAEVHGELAAAHGDRVWPIAVRRHRRGPGRGAGGRGRGAVRPGRRDGQQRRARRHRLGAGDDRRAVVASAGRDADRDVPVHPGCAAADGRPGRRRGRGQQRVGAGLAGAARAGALRGGQGRGHGADPVRRAGRGRARHPGQRGRAQPGHAPVPGQGDQRGAAGRPGARARRSAGRPSRGRWPTSSCSWPATTPLT